ncbi:MAG: DUF4832 domain-containing protein [Bacteroidota bacterium]
MKKALIFSCLLALLHVLPAQTFSTHTYAGSDSVLVNPERGFYRYTDRRDATSSMDPVQLKNFRKQGFTLIYRIFYMRDYVDQPISQAYLDRITEDFSRMREAGLKGVIRFAYTSSDEAPYGDASPDRINQHIAQLKPLLQANADVIMVLQAGFIGAWGEWYYTDYFADPSSPWIVSPENLEARRELLYNLLDALPADRMIQLRYVGYKMDFFGDSPLTEAESYSGTPKSRVAHHNDCFVSSYNDVGSYSNIVEEKNYLGQDTKFTAMGGETCKWYQSRSNCDTSVSEMERFHWTFINEDYYGPTLSNWKEEGCYVEMEKRLGYRYSLLGAEIRDSARQKGSFNLSLRLINTGFSNPVNPRAVELVLRNRVTGELFSAPVAVDLRRYELNTTIELAIEAGIPATMENGDYDLFLSLPDPEITLKNNPAYAIRLANDGVWNAELGMNDLGHVLHIVPAEPGPDYNGPVIFASAGTRTAGIPSAPGINLSSFARNVIVSNARSSEEESYRLHIERSTAPSGGFMALTVVPGKTGVNYFSDYGLEAEKTYYYRAYFSDGASVSEWSPVAAVTTGTGSYKYPVILADGHTDDWNAIVPAAAVAGDDGEYFLRAYFSREELCVLLEGDSAGSPQIYLNSDLDATTGENNLNWSSSGFEYRISGDSLSSYGSGAWHFRYRIDSLRTADGVYECKIPLTELEIESGQTGFRIAALMKLKNTEVVLPNESNPWVLERVLPSPLVTGLTVRHSVSIPTRLIATWDPCSGSDGYILTRTEVPTGIHAVFEFPPNLFQLIDDGLNINSLYSYSVCSYNFSGLSEETRVENISTGMSGSPAGETISVWPVPATTVLHVDGRMFPRPLEVSLYTPEGNLVYTGKMYGNLELDVEGFPRGMYLLQVSGNGQKVVRKIVLL